MTLTIVIPEWAFWLLAMLTLVSCGTAIWHIRALRTHQRVLQKYVDHNNALFPKIDDQEAA